MLRQVQGIKSKATVEKNTTATTATIRLTIFQIPVDFHIKVFAQKLAIIPLNNQYS